jgi:hypothetical protein
MEYLNSLFANINANLDLLPGLIAAIDELVLQTRFERLRQPLPRPDADEATEAV